MTNRLVEPWTRARLGGRARRRWVVGAAYLAYGGSALAAGLALSASAFFWPVAFGLMVVFLVAFVLLLGSSYYRVAQRPDSRLDERQRMVRDRAFRPAYWTIAALLVAETYYVTLASRLRFWLPSTFDIAEWIAFGTFILAVTLPTAIIAWTEPDLPDM